MDDEHEADELAELADAMAEAKRARRTWPLVGVAFGVGLTTGAVLGWWMSGRAGGATG